MSPMSPSRNGRAGPSASVVIPVLNAEPYLETLLEALLLQRPAPPEEILLVDSMSTDRTQAIAAAHGAVRVLPIRDFSHGRARNLGARTALGDVVVLMSQDALPADPHWLAHLLAPFADARVAGTFSRQIPRLDASPMERFFYSSHFPAGPPKRRRARPGERPTLDGVFFSNVSSALRRAVLLTHPFEEELIMSEDQQWARDVLAAGYCTVYVPDSLVVHSHDYTLTSAFRRYFDSSYSLRQILPAPGVLGSAHGASRYLRREALFMLRRHPWRLPYYALYTVARSAGAFCGRLADSLPRPVVRRLSLHSYHWK